MFRTTTPTMPETRKPPPEPSLTPTASQDDSVLATARGVTVSYRGRRVLDSVDLSLVKGRIVTLIGLNGSGKSTLVRLMVGLQQPDQGEVYRRPGLRVGFSPQHVHRDPTLPLTVERFITLGAPASRDTLRALLDEVGVGNILGSQIADISGGELHRVLLARALLRDPDLLVLDEPMAGVDVTGQSDLYRLIADIRDRRGCGVLLVSHDLHVVMAATDSVVCINHHVCCTGHPESVTRHPEFVSLFGAHVAESLAIYTHHHDHRHDASGTPLPLATDKAPASREGAPGSSP